MTILWSPIALVGPNTLCDCRDRSYALPGPANVATVATGYEISLVSRPRRLNRLRCAAVEDEWLVMHVEIPNDQFFGIREN